MKRGILYILLALTISAPAYAGGKLLYYFNRPVDNSVSTTVNAIYLHNCMADTLVAYINRAKYTIDVAQYDYNQGSYANIATAINNAYNRGVTVRWIYDGSSSNTGLSALNGGIHTLGSPTSGSYGIMHDKFVLIDANSADPNDAIVWTGSFDWSTEQFNTDANNTVVIQDSTLAHAYTDEFNQMWGGPGNTPTGASKFGSHKSDLGRHIFTIEGKEVELYFSPSDGTDAHIQTAIASANTDLYFGMYTFTESGDASMIVSKYNSGVYVAGIDDSYSNSYSPYTLFTSALGSNFKVYATPGIYHNKFLIVDPSDQCSDPLVLTGSHNWTVSADTKNDENTLIIHSDTAANVYYQLFHADFAYLGGALTTQNGCATGVATYAGADEQPLLFPNPASGAFTVKYHLARAQRVRIIVYDMMGKQVMQLQDREQQAGDHEQACYISTAGVYFLQYITEANTYSQKVIVANN